MKNAFFCLCLLAISMLIAQETRAAGWQVDYQKSRLEFNVFINGVSTTGHFRNFEANINFDPNTPETANIVVDVDTASIKMADVQQTAALKSADWFDVSNFPKARLRSVTTKAIGQNRYETTANLSIRDKTQPVKLFFGLNIKNNRARATGAFMLTRTDFDIGRGQFSSGATIGLSVNVTVEIFAHMLPQR